jgi:hypothetical protein
MNVDKVRKALAVAREELGKVTDAQFKAKQVNGLRTLTLADNAIGLVEKHLDKAVEQATRGQEAPAEETAAAGAPAKK